MLKVIQWNIRDCGGLFLVRAVCFDIKLLEQDSNFYLSKKSAYFFPLCKTNKQTIIKYKITFKLSCSTTFSWTISIPLFLHWLYFSSNILISFGHLYFVLSPLCPTLVYKLMETPMPPADSGSPELSCSSEWRGWRLWDERLAVEKAESYWGPPRQPGPWVSW